MFGFLLFLVVSYSALFTVVTIEKCKPDGYDDCYIFPWRSWGSCTGNCGHQKQNRKRFFCCRVDKIPHNLENCLKQCNFQTLLKHFKTKHVQFVKMEERCSRPHLHVFVVHGTKAIVVKVGKIQKVCVLLISYIFCKKSIDMSFTYFTNSFSIESLMRLVTNVKIIIRC